MTDSKGALHTLERNRFFYGKVMDVRQWRLEQSYGIEARSLLARLGLGIGVLSGLEVELAPDGTALRVRAGVAVDGLGRTIVVPADVTLPAPGQPTDCKGAPDGDPVTDGSITVELCYHECLTESVPTIACGCDTVERCEAGVVGERYRLRLIRGLPSPADPVACPAMFPADPDQGFDRRRAIWETLGAAPIPPRPSDEDDPCGCLVLATIAFTPDGPAVLDPFTYRRTIYSNQALLELILCLAARVDDCCREHQPPPAATPPRVMRLWPGDGSVIDALPDQERQHWLKAPRIELAFERPIADAILDAPDDWLRAWSIVRSPDGVLARRIALTRESGGESPILDPVGGEEVARYRLDQEYRPELQSARVLVQLRPGDTGAPVVVDGSTPPLLLDGEHRGTGLDQATLDGLWTTIETTGTLDADAWDALLTGAPPPLPSGDGAPGGHLDAAFAFALPEVVVQPKLLAIWPPSAMFLRPRADSAEVRQWRIDFREAPHLELTFEASLDEPALAAVPIGDWLRLWWLPELVPTSGKRLVLAYAGVEPGPHRAVPGSTTIRIGIQGIPFPELDPNAPNHLAWILRGDRAAVDADFDGLRIDPAAGDALWNADAWTAGQPAGPPSAGVSLADGDPGGTVTAFFDYADKA